MRANEKNFVDFIRKRREEGISYVIETYGGMLQSIVKKRLFSWPDQVDECMNDIFLGIWQNIDSFDESKGSFAGWAAGVARLEAIDTLRRLQRQPRMVSLEEMEVEIPQEDRGLLELARQELSKETEEILGCLSPKDQELFRRIFLQEEEPEAAGNALGITRNNVYVHIFRGKARIRKKVEKGKGHGHEQRSL
ncbi:MAG: sigma-70 family RNA polymerase sigma factor [Lachnospiraceae bacterium]|nr:sigma-70 family RNA polymerase sigma factor [Lachnospiraceae bacterium]